MPSPFSDLPQQQLAGYSTGTDVHLHLLQAMAQQLAHAEVAFTGASVASQGTDTRPAFGPAVGATQGDIVNEFGQVVQPQLPVPPNPPSPPDSLLTGNKSFGRGSALEVGLGNPVPNDGGGQISLPGRVQASAPPDHVPTTPHSTVPPDECLPTDPLCKELAAVPAGPLAYAQLLQNEAAARWDNAAANNNCLVGTPYGEGEAHAADVQLIDTANPSPATNPLTAPLVTTNAPASGRSAGQSWSNERLVNQTQSDGTPLPTSNGNLALMSETRQTIAPISLAWTPATPANPLTGQPAIPAHPAVTIEVLGEWTLQAIAGGLHNSAYVHYAPDANTQNNITPVLRVTSYNPATGQPNPNPSEFFFQQLVGNNGLAVNLPPSPTTGPFLLQIHVAAKAHQIGDPSGTVPEQVDTTTGQFAAGAVDVLRVNVINQPDPNVPGTQVADIRAGHMESLAQVGQGGMSCPLPVQKTDAGTIPVTNSTNTFVVPGQNFTYNIAVANPYDCDLTSLHLVDQLTADPGVKFTVTSPANGGNVTLANPSGPTTITWDNQGSLSAHSPPTHEATVTVHVDPTSGPGTFHDTVTATGPCTGAGADNLLNLTGAPMTVNLTGTDTLDDPVVFVDCDNDADGPTPGGTVDTGEAAECVTSGAPGPEGPPGPQGPPGARGPQGPQGPPGTDCDGDNDNPAPDGTRDPNEAAECSGPQGPPGTNGTNGSNGATGPQGPGGAQGSTGSQGSTGATGATGPAGATGAAGANGANGSNGVSPSTAAQPQVLGTSFSQSSPATAQQASPSFTG